MSVSDKNIKAFIRATKVLNKAISNCKKDASDCLPARSTLFCAIKEAEGEK